MPKENDCKSLFLYGSKIVICLVDWSAVRGKSLQIFPISKRSASIYVYPSSLEILIVVK